MCLCCLLATKSLTIFSRILFTANHPFDFPDANVLHVFANDSDKTSRNSDLDYFIIGGSFSINSSTGDVYVQPNLKLDRERQDFYNLTVKAIDHGSPPQTGTALVYITILDVNDELPEFNKTSYSVDVKENHTTLNAVTCFAYDVDENHDLVFNITKWIATDERGNPLADSSLVAVSINLLSYITVAVPEVVQMACLNPLPRFEYPMKMKKFGLIETKLFHLHGKFKKIETKSAKPTPIPLYIQTSFAKSWIRYFINPFYIK